MLVLLLYFSGFPGKWLKKGNRYILFPFFFVPWTNFFESWIFKETGLASLETFARNWAEITAFSCGHEQNSRIQTEIPWVRVGMDSRVSAATKKKPPFWR